MKTKGIILGVISVLGGLINASADVIINEISARASEHLLKYSEPGPDGIPRLGTGTVWTDLSYDDSFWTERQALMGYDTEGINADLGPEMRDITPSLYLRKTFTVSSEIVALEEIVTLFVEYDDGFVAYLNGKEIARGHTGPPNSFVFNEQEAYNAHTSDGFEEFPLEDSVVADHLVEGENILAIQIHNNDMASGLKFDAKLSYKGFNPLGGKVDRFLIDDEDTWKTLVGVVEPSGGLFDPGLLGSIHFDGNFADWIEIYNNGDLSVDLTGWTLADSGDELPWEFPAGTTIGPREYLVVIADGLGGVDGVDDIATYLHTNFSLTGSGEYLGLANDSGVIQSEFDDYPKQGYFHTYGINPADGLPVYFSEATPGAANTGPVFSGFVKEPKFDQSGGFHDTAFDLTITSSTEGAEIRYTTDGSEPTPTSGTLYEGPIRIEQVAENQGTVIRARAFHEGMIESNLRTRTFLVGQHTALKTLPAVIITGDRGRSLYHPNGVAATEGGKYSDVSLQYVWDAEGPGDYNLPMAHGREVERPASLEVRYPDGSPGFHINMGLRAGGSDHTRRRYRFTEVETPSEDGLLPPWDKDAIPWESSPNTNNNYPAFTRKPSFNFVFRGEYDNDGILDFPLFEGDYTKFPTLRLRAGKNDPVNPFIIDEFGRRLYLDMGAIGAIGAITTAYVNGDFKGHFNLVERLKEEFFQDRYNTTNEWDIRERDGATEGDLAFYDEWAAFMQVDPYKNPKSLNDLTPGVDLTNQANYEKLQEYFDIENYIDYMLINIWFNSSDWPQNNFFIARERKEGSVMRFYLWDIESSLDHNNSGRFPANYNMVQNGGRIDVPRIVGEAKDHPITYLWRALIKVPDFRLHFADRVQKHFILSDAALHEDNLRARYEELRDEFQPIFEYVHGPEGRTFNDARISNWIRDRQLYLFESDKSNDEHFAGENLWYRKSGQNEISSKTPIFSGQFGGRVPTGHSLKISGSKNPLSPFSGEVFVTTDGSDPREFGGEPNPGAIVETGSVTIELTESVTVKSRTRLQTGEWSVLMEADYFVGILASDENLVVTEIMYRPSSPSEVEIFAGYTSRSDFEYIELMNIGPDRIELDNVRITGSNNGIDFSFDNSQFIEAGARILLVRNRPAFEMRYGVNDAIAGTFTANLGSTDTIRVIDKSSGSNIREFTYDDRGDWPEGPDGDGYSLVLMEDPTSNPGDLSNPASWRTSSLQGGSPGGKDTISIAQIRSLFFDEAELANPLISGDDADPDKDGMVNFLELALSARPKDPGDLNLPKTKIVQVDPGTGEVEDFLSLRYRYRPGNDEYSYQIEVSDDLVTWTGIGDQNALTVETNDRGDGSVEVTVRDSVPLDTKNHRYIRLVVSVDSEDG